MYKIAKGGSPEQVNIELKPYLGQLLPVNPYIYWVGAELGDFLLESITDPAATYEAFKEK